MVEPRQAIPVTVVIPTIPGRTEMLHRAVYSVQKQTVWAEGGIEVELDVDRTGAAATRNRALDRVLTPWVAFLDDDDVFLPYHLATCWEQQLTTQADVVYPGCEVVAGLFSLPHDQHELEWGNFGEPFDPSLLRDRSCIPVTSLVRTELAQRARFGAPEGSIYDDWGFYLRLLEMGATFSHVPVRTWLWYHHDHNTSGQPDRKGTP